MSVSWDQSPGRSCGRRRRATYSPQGEWPRRPHPLPYEDIFDKCEAGGDSDAMLGRLTKLWQQTSHE